MKNIIFINGYNNYYNRRVKYSQNLNDYINNYDCFIKDNINFNPNDGVKASITANLDIDINADSPDYALLLDENSNILSRWFVIDLIRNRNGQYNVQLKRDVIADHFDKIKDLPVFVHKANLAADNPLIFNNEGMQFNQIKTSEVKLMDDTKTSWIVGYCDGKIAAEEEVIVNSSIKASDVPTLESLDIDWDIENNKGIARFPNKIQLRYNLSVGTAAGGILHGTAININNNFTPTSYTSATATARNAAYQLSNPQRVDQSRKDWYTELLKYVAALRVGLDDYYNLNLKIADAADIAELKAFEGQIVYSRTTDRYYTLSIQELAKTFTANIENVNLIAVCDATTNDVVDNADYVITKRNDAVYFITTEYKEYNVILLPAIAPSQATLRISTNTYNKLTDAPYSMFVLRNTPVNLDLATKLATAVASHIYDIQLLPYCPVKEMINLDTLKPLEGKALLEEVDYNIINFQDSDEVDYLYWAKTSSGAFIIQQSIPAPVGAIETKIMNECDMYRLVSPNYNGVFEFSAAKNNGVTNYDVVYTYKPYSPYIRVSPEFKGLYGQDFADARGLICNGNFSIATINEQWKTFEINNKNYENIFNAQIKTMDKNNQLNLVSQGITSTLGAAATGVTVGALGGGVAGGIAAGVGSLAGGVGDIAIGQSVYQNNRQLQKDLYNYNLQNIKARPDTLNKISAYTVDNKYFPIVEYYTCTDTEKNALKNKIKYEGMTVMAIGTINEYIGAAEDFNYFKGQLIQCGDISEDYHIIDAIAVELERGIYLPGGNN